MKFKQTNKKLTTLYFEASAPEQVLGNSTTHADSLCLSDDFASPALSRIQKKPVQSLDEL